MDATSLVDQLLRRLSTATYPALIGWPIEQKPSPELKDHLLRLKQDAPQVVFLANVVGCLFLQAAVLLRFAKPLSRVQPSKRDRFILQLATSDFFKLRLLMMLLKSHALLAGYRAPSPTLSPPLYDRRPPWTATL